MSVGDTAPDFTLPGMADGDQSQYCLSDTVADGTYVGLFFYPFDFSPVCTNELCAIRDAEFFQFMDNVVTWGVSGDSAYSHRVFNEQYGFDFPLLADSNGAVSSAYDVQYERWEGHQHVPKRAIVLVDPDRRIRYRWVTDDALEKPDLFPFKEALETIIEEDDFGTDLPDDDLAVDYDESVVTE